MIIKQIKEGHGDLWFDLNNSALMKDVLRELLIECPMGGNPVNCLLHEKRNLPLSSILSWVEFLSDKERISEYMTHSVCQRIKDESLYKNP